MEAVKGENAAVEVDASLLPGRRDLSGGLNHPNGVFKNTSRPESKIPNAKSSRSEAFGLLPKHPC
jgi:hypothetical protein